MVMKTPGVYVVEKNAFPNSVVQVATAVPAFIGYSETALNGHVPLTMKPWRIASMAEFHDRFGGPPEPVFRIEPYEDFGGASPLSVEGSGSPPPLPRAVFTTTGPAGEEKHELVQANPAYALYGAMRLFFLNGGSSCYVVSIGSYKDEIDAERMLDAIRALKVEPEPTMVVIPETTRLARRDAVKVQREMLKHCGTDMRNRFAILDISGGHLPQQDSLGNPIATFRNDIGTNDLSFGAAYYPWLDASVYRSHDFTYRNIHPESRQALIGLMELSVDNDPAVAQAIERIGAPVVSGDFTISVPKGATIPVTTADVTVIDDDSGAEGLTYSVEGSTRQMGGRLQLDGADATSFTQADLEAGKVTFVHDGESPSGRFALVVADRNAIATGALTIAVEVVGGLIAPPAIASQAEVRIDVPAAHPDGDPATLRLIEADDDGGKTKSVPGVGIWRVGEDGEVTFTLDAAFRGPEARATYTIDVAGRTAPPSELRVLMAGEASVTALARPTVETIDKTLRATVPLYAEVMDVIASYMNASPPAAAMAGIYTAVDNNRGVWKAPANVSLAAVVAPMVKIDHEEQENLKVSTTGKPINAIRHFVGEGTLVWGARTLDGNSLDWRYINVRRTMIMIEESIRLACKAYVFEPNTANTWATMRSMIENFLTSAWKQGGLAGAVPADAFSVHVGLGETMTPADILEGILRVTVLVAIVRPAEFIEFTIEQQMQKS